MLGLCETYTFFSNDHKVLPQVILVVFKQLLEGTDLARSALIFEAQQDYPFVGPSFSKYLFPKVLIVGN
jgi:hypothetical protein